MSRDAAYFERSRLYRQAEELAVAILHHLQGDSSLRIALHECLGVDAIVLRSESECRSAAERIAEFIDSLSLRTDLAIPSFIELGARVYFKDFVESQRWIGIGAKVALERVWPRVWGAGDSGSASIASHVSAIRAAFLLYEIELARKAIILAGDKGNEGVTLTPSGFRFSNSRADRMLRHLSSTMNSVDSPYRTTTSTQRLFTSPGTTVGAILQALDGADPAQIQLFSGTLFAAVPQGGAADFWRGLLARFLLLIAAIDTRQQVMSTHIGVTIMGQLGLLISANIFSQRAEQEKMQSAVASLFWQRKWFEGRTSGGAIGELVVERPIMRFTRTDELFATAGPLIFDSISWFVEASVMRYTQQGGHPLPESVFQSKISSALEERVCAAFRKAGFEAGQLTKEGMWDLGDDKRRLRHLADEKCPGELDVLALHRPSGHLFAIECKVLGLPFTESAIRNVMSKVGPDDAESFHSKVNAKLEWVRGCEGFSRFNANRSGALLVLDRPMPGMTLDPMLHVIAADAAEGFARELVEIYKT
ncbi:hypothetical protein [Corallococcus exercitus]|uniref:Uncharacterized protein n=1 Tax=Corallococcus exercitus TaxID=2316736 RepID=A0A7Y4JNA3_9BACT|nr:hypothetical protein [Corallococcus exercitus]NOK08150.1 hypothetical protein [Corallococcus exercitus]